MSCPKCYAPKKRDQFGGFAGYECGGPDCGPCLGNQIQQLSEALQRILTHIEDGDAVDDYWFEASLTNAKAALERIGGSK